MFIVTADEMRRMDQYTIHTIGITSLVLMENAGRSAAEEIIRISQEWTCKSVNPRWIILIGKGNNGGDGLVIARRLYEAGIYAELLFVVPPEQLSGDAAVQRDIANRLGLGLSMKVYGDAPIHWQNFDGIVDALLGTGTQGAPREPYASLIHEANQSGLPIAAIDVPSGLHPDTGGLYDPCIRAQWTITFAFTKRGLQQHPGADIAGQVIIKPIGIPAQIAEEHGVRTYGLDADTFPKRLQLSFPETRKADSHKGTYGHVLLAAGSSSMSGAGFLSSQAALRAGCGLVTWAVPDDLLPHLAGHVPEVMLAGITRSGEAAVSSHSADLSRSVYGQWKSTDSTQIAKLAESRDTLAVGPGMGRFEGDSLFVRSIWENVQLPLVLDADALNAIADAGDFASWPKRSAAVILTPHPGEMARLLGVSTQEVQRDRIETARRFASQHGITLVLKGTHTVIAAPDGRVYVNPTGNAGMSTGGAGDVLTGIIAGLLAQGLDAIQAACLGVYLHGEAGDRAAAKRQHMRSLIAGDILNEL